MSTPYRYASFRRMGALTNSRAAGNLESQQSAVNGSEMNGNWEAWGYTHASPADYIAAWRHAVTVFRAAGATT